MPSKKFSRAETPDVPVLKPFSPLGQGAANCKLCVRVFHTVESALVYCRTARPDSSGMGQEWAWSRRATPSEIRGGARPAKWQDLVLSWNACGPTCERCFHFNWESIWVELVWPTMHTKGPLRL